MKKKTKNPVIWLRYWAWCLRNWTSKHRMAYPMWLRHFLLTKLFPDQRRWGLSWRQVEDWKKYNPDYRPTYFPLPWWVGQHALGPFYGLPSKLTRSLGKFAGASHRCEFTDKEHGALYTGNVDPFMDRLFEQFIQNISRDVDEQDRLEEWAGGVQN